MKSVIPTDADIYYHGKYWNDIPELLEYIYRHFNQDNPRNWIDDFSTRFAKKPFKKALFICCGNGWSDRLFIDRKIVLEADAFDYSNDLLSEAKKNKGKRKINYFQADANKITFSENEYDLVVNVAGLHHVQYINKFCVELARAIKPDGLFVNFDYIGPRRNQYSRAHWRVAKQVNSKLTKLIKLDHMPYPDLPTMLVTDPTEAIHSDIVISTLSRYFSIQERHDINGGLAYLLLTHNPKVWQLKESIRKIIVLKILKLDHILTQNKKVPVMFSYFIVKVRKKALADISLLNTYQREENIREAIAEKMRSCYTLLEYAIVVLNPIIYKLRIYYYHLRKRLNLLEEA